MKLTKNYVKSIIKEELAIVQAAQNEQLGEQLFENSEAAALIEAEEGGMAGAMAEKALQVAGGVIRAAAGKVLIAVAKKGGAIDQVAEKLKGYVDAAAKMAKQQVGSAAGKQIAMARDAGVPAE